MRGEALEKRTLDNIEEQWNFPGGLEEYVQEQINKPACQSLDWGFITSDAVSDDFNFGEPQELRSIAGLTG